MSKILMVVGLVALIALLACGDDEESGSQAGGGVPQVAAPTSMPTAVSEGTEAVGPTEAGGSPLMPTLGPVGTSEALGQVSGGGVIVLFDLDDPMMMSGELLEGEAACMSSVSEPGRLAEILSGGDWGDPGELEEILGCLEDETVLRLFVSGVMGGSGELSVESSECVRGGLSGGDLRSVMLAGIGGDAEAGMVGGMGAMFLTLSCLNDEEWRATAPLFGMGVEDRENVQCLLQLMGGPEGLSKVMSAGDAGDEGSAMVVFNAATACGLDPEGETGVPTVGPAGTETPTVPTGVPTVGPAVTVTPGGVELTEGQDRVLAGILAGLTDVEIACLETAGFSVEELRDPAVLETASSEQHAQVLGCLGDEVVLEIYLSWIVGDPGLIGAGTELCIESGIEGIDLRAVMVAGADGDDSGVLADGLGAMSVVVSCMSDEELEAAEPTLGMMPEDRESMVCLMDTMGGPQGFRDIMDASNVAGYMMLLAAVLGCGLEMENLVPGG